MKVLCIAIGNSLRGDDGVAHRVAARMEPRDEVVTCGVFQLTPETAPEVARAETVVFLDADIDAREPAIEAVNACDVRGTPLAHSMTPREIVWLAKRLYGFAGQVKLNRLPVESFDGEGLSEAAEASRARRAPAAARTAEGGGMTKAGSGERLRIDLEGAVQGVGFRPFVYRLACELGLTGWVRNSNSGLTGKWKARPRRWHAL